jgi:hypothetical protein
MWQDFGTDDDDDDEYYAARRPAPEATEPITYWVPQHRLDALKDKLDKLVRKAQRLNVGAIAYAIGEPVDRPYQEFTDADTGNPYYKPYTPPAPDAWAPPRPPHIVYFRFYPVVVTGTTPRIAGWSFAATLQHLTDDKGETVNLLRVTPSFTEQLPEKYRHADASNCDHCCRTIRTRKDTYILRSDETGKYMQVGRNCTQDFLGGKNPHDVAQYMEALFSAMSSASESEEGGFGGSGERRFPITAFLTQVAAVIRVKGWMSRGKARESSYAATADITLDVLNPPFGGGAARREWAKLRDEVLPDDEDKKTAEATLEYARETLSLKEERDDYEHNLYVALTQPTVDRRLAGIIASAVPYYLRYVEREVKRAAMRKSAGDSQWVGEIGERRDFTVIPLMVKPIETQYGVTYLHKFVTPEGNLLTWFASTDPDVELGKEYRITALVKKHDDYQGVKQTVITRGTVWTELAIEQEKIKAEARAEKDAIKAAKAAVKAEKAAAREAKAAIKAAKAAAKTTTGFGEGWDGRMHVRKLDRRDWVFVNNVVHDGDENDRMLLAVALGEDERDELEAYVLGPTPTGGAIVAIVSSDDGGEIDRFRVE